VAGEAKARGGGRRRSTGKIGPGKNADGHSRGEAIEGPVERENNKLLTIKKRGDESRHRNRGGAQRWEKKTSRGRPHGLRAKRQGDPADSTKGPARQIRGLGKALLFHVAGCYS